MRLAVGVDVAGPGEAETVAYAHDMDAGNIVAFQAWLKRDPRGDVLNFLRTWEHKGHTIEIVNVDSVGSGYYFALHIRDAGYHVQEINVGETPDDAKDKKRYKLKKDQYYWYLRERFQEGTIGGLTDDVTIAQLTAIEYRYNEKGQVEIESKDELKERGMDSPDRAEALMLSFVPPRKARKRNPLPVTISVRHARS